MTRNKILATLPHLSREDLTAIRAAASSLLSQQVEVNDPYAPLYHAIIFILGMSLPYQEFVNTTTHRHFAANAPDVLDYLHKTFPAISGSKALETAMLHYSVELVITSLKAQKIPISLSGVVVNLPRLPVLYSAAFPDYTESGMMHLIPAAMERK